MSPRKPVELPTMVDELLARQDGVISRTQVLESGGDSALVRRMLDRGLWVREFSGVYLTHTGPPSWSQRAWASVLHAGRAALCDRSAIIAAGGTVDGRGRDDGPIHVAVDAHRNMMRRPAEAERTEVVVHHLADLEDRVAWQRRPPRLRAEYAALDVASAAPTEFDAIARLAEAVQQRVTTASRLIKAHEKRHNYRRHSFLAAVLTDVRDGACSVLEHRYLTDVERAHGLPAGARQSPTKVGRRGFRDVEYDEYSLIVELDGRFGHDDPHSRDRDFERDLDALSGASRTTARLGSGQVFSRPCATAGKVAQLLSERGWTGSARPCSRDCALGQPPA